MNLNLTILERLPYILRSMAKVQNHRGSEHQLRSSENGSSRRRSGRTSRAARGIIVSLPGHDIGLTKLPITSDNLEDTTPEMWASRILSCIEDDASDTRPGAKWVGRAIVGSIEHSDPTDLKLMKRLGAMSCGFYSGFNYKRMVPELDRYLTAAQLSEVCLYLCEWSSPHEHDIEWRVRDIMKEISGFRVESSFFRLARACKLEIRESSAIEDQHGGIDFFVEGVPFDIKSSYEGAKRGLSGYPNKSKRSSVKFVPPLIADDFKGRLVVPTTNIRPILEETDFKAMVTHAIGLFRRQKK